MWFFLKLKILNNQTIKITLTKEYMEKYNTNYNILNNNKKITKNLILKILKHCKEKTAIDFNKHEVFIDLFKTKEKGCVIYVSVSNKIVEKTDISKTKQKIKTKTPTIATFKKINNMKNFCNNVMDLFPNNKFESELYCFEDKFVLTVFVPEYEKEKFLAIIKEFGKVYGKGKIKYGTIKEHCKQIFKQNAIMKIIKTKTKLV